MTDGRPNLTEGVCERRRHETGLRTGLAMLDYLRQGRECYERGAWTDAHRALLLADQSAPLDVDDLERLSTSAYLIGHDLEFERCVGRRHRAHVEAGERDRAARCTFWLGLALLFRGETTQANAWIARGQRLIAGCDCVERGYLLLPLAEQQVRDGRVAAAHMAAATAAAIGDRFGDADLVALARHVQGRALIRQDQVLAGLELLDETMLAVIAGDLSPIVTGLMYCSVIEACRQVYALSRARDWTFALSAWCEGQSEAVAFNGTCLVHRAEIMQFQGAWPDALAEASLACERSERADRKPPAAALYQQAEIHRLRGEYARAEEAYRGASRMGYDPQPGLALLRMAQGQTDAACAAIRQLVSATTDRIRRARLLPAWLEIMLAAGDLQEARGACGELQSASEAFEADVLRATAVAAQGAIALAEGNAQEALGPLRGAFEAWTRLEAPYESARVRVLIGLACRGLGDEETTALEFGAARAVFEQLGARPDLTRLDSLDAAAPSRQEHRLSARERDVLRLIAAGHTNKAIAAKLFVSERTIDRHVSNILGKLDVPSRAAATAYAYEHKLF
jgi:DNA-binding CsgD family transcriptional regulator